ncbi:hypothetical protein [Pantoea sp. 18069]|uniref:hypothetical protein n=1 Tax=Pantoea sp. 18069 TaxID=2681415 RepID=UPI00135BFA73|nr:hypothetical protein [Pantoea sp. 18069]
MKNKVFAFMRTILIFSISPGFVGAPYLAIGVSLHSGLGLKYWIDNLYLIPGVVFVGFMYGIFLYGAPAMMLGVIYGFFEFKRGWRSYIFVIFFSPVFLIMFDNFFKYFIPEMRFPIFYASDAGDKFFYTMVLPLSSLASIVAGRLSFYK